MTRRTTATLVAAALTVLLAIGFLAMPLPYVRYQPGVTVDMLSERRGEERIQVTGHKVYRDDGELRMLTIMATPPKGRISLLRAMLSWASPDESVKRYAEVYGNEETEKAQERDAAVQMSTSQDDAVVAAMTQLGYDVPRVPVVGPLTDGLPADGKLVPRDRYLAIGGAPIKSWDDVVKAISTATPGKPLAFKVERGGKELTTEVTPVRDAQSGRVVIGVQRAYDYKMPFKVTLDMADSNGNDNIGGPSAGLMFALSIYDTLTPGSLTGGRRIAGTGTITPEGVVGPIGGIQQKVAGARRAGATLFLVPAINCDEAVTGARGSMRLTAVETLDDAEKAVSTYAANPKAHLPTCEEYLAP
jgi:PDZ domain-containing protein